MPFRLQHVACIQDSGRMQDSKRTESVLKSRKTVAPSFKHISRFAAPVSMAITLYPRFAAICTPLVDRLAKRALRGSPSRHKDHNSQMSQPSAAAWYHQPVAGSKSSLCNGRVHRQSRCNRATSSIQSCLQVEKRDRGSHRREEARRSQISAQSESSSARLPD